MRGGWQRPPAAPAAIHRVSGGEWWAPPAGGTIGVGALSLLAVTARAPSLCVPLSLVAGAAAWLIVEVGFNPLVALVDIDARRIAVACAAPMGAAAGAWLARANRNVDAWTDASATLVPASIVVVLSGIAAGALAGALAWASLGGAVGGAVVGLVGALAAWPACVLVLAAARRAVRARRGSLVARADRRSIRITLAGIVALATAFAAIDWPASTIGPTAKPTVAVFVLVACAIAIGIDAAGQLRAWRALARIAVRRETMMPCAGSFVGSADVGARVDVGLGDAMAARFDRVGHAYRDHVVVRALVLGSVASARRALAHHLCGAGLAIAAVVCAAITHVAARHPEAAIAYAELRCSAQHDEASCVAAARLAEARAHDGPTTQRAASLYDVACRHEPADASSCAALARVLESGALGAADHSRAQPIWMRACEHGDGASCIQAARTLLHSDVRERDGVRAIAYLERGCVVPWRIEDPDRDDDYAALRGCDVLRRIRTELLRSCEDRRRNRLVEGAPCRGQHTSKLATAANDLDAVLEPSGARAALDALAPGERAASSR